MTAALATHSIYETVSSCSSDRTASSRLARRAREEALIHQIEECCPPRTLERTQPIQTLLFGLRKGSKNAEDLANYLEKVESELIELEKWASSLSKERQESHGTIRAALVYLRNFGRMAILNFSDLPIEIRPGIVSLLAAEHRWCYAAAGTTRQAFKNTTGRTGAR